jgi:4-carboxymuconolactone decarboxylase
VTYTAATEAQRLAEAAGISLADLGEVVRHSDAVTGGPGRSCCGRPGDFFGLTVGHLFAEIWNRPGLSFRDGRLPLIGLLVGGGLDDVVPLQLGAALATASCQPTSCGRSSSSSPTTPAGLGVRSANSQVEELLAQQPPPSQT